MESNNISVYKKDEVVTDKNGNIHILQDSSIRIINAAKESIKDNRIILIGNVRSGKTAALEYLKNQLKELNQEILIQKK